MWASEMLKQTHFDIPEDAEPIEKYAIHCMNLNGGILKNNPGELKMYIQD